MSTGARPERPTQGDPLLSVLGPLDGAQIPGGCERCEAYQTATLLEAGVWSLTVHHDDDCPWLAARRRSS